MKNIFLIVSIMSTLFFGCAQPNNVQTQQPVTPITGTWVMTSQDGTTTTTLALYDGYSAYWWEVTKSDGVTVSGQLPLNIANETTIYYKITGNSLRLYWYNGSITHDTLFEIQGETITNFVDICVKQK